MVTLSAELCKCGTQMEYKGVSKTALQCPHCDTGCSIKPGECPLCEEFSQEWKKFMKTIYGPGRGL